MVMGKKGARGKIARSAEMKVNYKIMRYPKLPIQKPPLLKNTGL